MNTNTRNHQAGPALTEADITEMVALKRQIGYARQRAAEAFIGGDVETAVREAAAVNALRLELAENQLRFAKAIKHNANRIHSTLMSALERERTTTRLAAAFDASCAGETDDGKI